MKKTIKEVFNLRTILICYIGAIGYGIGYNVPNSFGVHPVICIISCIVFGRIFDAIAKKVLTTDYFNSSRQNRFIIAIAVYSSYLVVWLIVKAIIDYDLDYDFFAYLFFVIIFQAILLFKTLLLKLLEKKKIKDTKK